MLRDVRRLFLAGNSLSRNLFTSEPFHGLVQLDLSSCRLDKLPANFASLVPNCRVLALDANFLSDLESLSGLARLQKLTATGNRLGGIRPLADVITTMPELRHVDVRYVCHCFEC